MVNIIIIKFMVTEFARIRLRVITGNGNMVNFMGMAI
jgi:hypothetical protein